jgi:hypothetical protein
VVTLDDAGDTVTVGVIFVGLVTFTVTAAPEEIFPVAASVALTVAE